MKKITILLIALMVISVSFLSGCLSSEENKLIGRWSSGGETMGMELKFYTEWFSKKVDYYAMGIKYTLDWSTDNGRLCLSGDAPNTEACWGYSFEGNDRLILEIIPGMPTTLNKVE